MDAQIRLELLRLYGDKNDFTGLSMLADWVLNGIIPPAREPVPAPEVKKETKSTRMKK